MREDRDLTQAQIAAVLLCDQSLYSKYERGERALPLDLAIKLADYYHTSIDYLVGRTNVSALTRRHRGRNKKFPGKGALT